MSIAGLSFCMDHVTSFPRHNCPTCPLDAPVRRLKSLPPATWDPTEDPIELAVPKHVSVLKVIRLKALTLERAQEILDFCGEHLATIIIPSSTRFSKAIPVLLKREGVALRRVTRLQ